LSAKLVFLGRLADVAGASELVVESGPLEAVLAGLDPVLVVALLDERVRIALNGEVLPEPAVITLVEGDELAFLPPVSGG
jgi:molybdopterin synthase sulfur carrier subunit